MIKHNSDILNKLFFKELQMLIEKYNKIDEKDKENVLNYIKQSGVLWEVA